MNNISFTGNSVDIVSRIPLLKKYCTPEQQFLLNQSAVCCTYKKNDLIFYEHAPALSIFFILSGTMVLWKEDIHMRQNKNIIRFAKDGDLLGYRGSFTGNYIYQISASALEDSKICCVAKDIFEKTLKENPELNSIILLNHITELEKTGNRLHVLARMSTREKVAEALLIIKDTFGYKGKDNTIPVTVSFSRKDIADIAGISIGKTIKRLSEFRAENIISTCGSKISFLNSDKLSAIVEKFQKRTSEKK